MLRVIGILGGIGSGKSTVAGMFEKLGAKLIDADKLAHEALAMPEIEDKIREVWKDSVFTGGKVDRKKLADIVFRSRDEIKRLNAIVHPRVAAVINKVICATRAGKDVSTVVLDAPLLAETGLDAICDVLVYVDAPFELKKERSAAGKGLDGPELERRENLQISLDKKRGKAHYVVDNSKSEGSTFQQVSSIWENLCTSIMESD